MLQAARDGDLQPSDAAQPVIELPSRVRKLLSS